MLKKIKSEHVEKLDLIFKIIYLVHLCLCFTVFGAGNKVTLVLTLVMAGMLILYRTINIKRYIDFKNLKILLFFLVSYIISSILSIKYGIFENIQCFIWMFMQITLLYTFNIEQEKKSVIKEFRILMSVLICVVSLINLMSLMLLFLKISSFYTALSGDIYIYGISKWGRLYGVATDPNYMSVLSSAAIILSIYFIKTSKTKKAKILNILSIIIQFLFISFAGSRTALVSTIVGIGIYVALLSFQKIREHKVMKTIPIVVLTCLIIVIGFNGIVKGYNYLSEAIEKNIVQNDNEYGTIEKTIEEKASETGEKTAVIEENDSIIKKKNAVKIDYQSAITQTSDIKIGREETIKNDISNRRFDIWKSGFEIFKTNWLFGLSFRNIVPYVLENLPTTYIVDNDFAIFNAFHNTIIDVFVAQGILGGVLILYFAISTLRNTLKNRKNILTEEDIDIYNVTLSICILIFVSAMFLSHIFYVNSPTTCVFWLALGYLTFIIEKNKNNEREESK